MKKTYHSYRQKWKIYIKSISNCSEMSKKQCLFNQFSFICSFAILSSSSIWSHLSIFQIQSITVNLLDVSRKNWPNRIIKAKFVYTSPYSLQIFTSAQLGVIILRHWVTQLWGILQSKIGHILFGLVFSWLLRILKKP